MEEKIVRLANTYFTDHKHLFLMSLTVSPTNDAIVVIDGDGFVDISTCVDFNRYLENALADDVDNFSLKIMSYGLDNPLKQKRQYKKHLNKFLKITKKDATDIKGVLKEVLPKGVVLESKNRIPKSVGKGKITVVERHNIDWSDISESKVIVTF